MTDKKELNEQELENVNGGLLWVLDDQMDADFTNKIDKYDTENYIGQNLYFVYYTCNGEMDSYDYNYEWIYGTLLRSYEASSNCSTLRMFDVQVIESHDSKKNTGMQSLSSFYYRVYKDKVSKI